MQDVYFRCREGLVECHPKFISCSKWSEVASTIVKFATVLFTAEPFLAKPVVSITLDVTNEEIYISDEGSVLVSRQFELWPSKEELSKMLFTMLSEIVS